MRSGKTNHSLLIGNGVRRTIRVVYGNSFFLTNMRKQLIYLGSDHISTAVLAKVCVCLVGGIAMHHTSCSRRGKRGDSGHGGEECAAEGEVQMKFHGGGK